MDSLPVNIPPSMKATPEEYRRRIVAFEDAIKQGEQVEIPVIQYSCNGVYVREITIPAGVILTGKIHKHPCLSIVLTGKMEVITDEGPRIIEAPLVYESPAGVKRGAPVLGGDTVEVLAEAGFSAEEIGELRAAGAAIQADDGDKARDRESAA